MKSWFGWTLLILAIAGVADGFYAYRWYFTRDGSSVAQPSTNTQWHPWTVGETYTLADGQHHPAFEISTWGSDDGYYLVGHFVYRARRYPDDHPVAALHGTQRDDWFWPNVTLQVSPNCRDSWKTIGTAHEGDETLQLDSSKGGAGLTISFEPFKGWIGKAECGRVVLESGELDSFSLSSLVPPLPQNPPAP
jgi:hypothetical protein